MRTPDLVFAIAVALCSPLASQLVAAQTAPVTDPREMSDAVRKAYSKGLKDARKLLAEKKYA